MSDKYGLEEMIAMEFEYDIIVWKHHSCLRIFHTIQKNDVEIKEYFDKIYKDKKTELQVDNLTKEAVSKYTAIGMSGIYPLSKELEDFIFENFNKTIFVMERII